MWWIILLALACTADESSDEDDLLSRLSPFKSGVQQLSQENEDFDHTYRLPGDIVPLSYDLTFTIGNASVHAEGRAIIKCEVKRDTSNIIFNMVKKKINITEIYIYNMEDEIEIMSYDSPRQTMTLRLKQPLTANTEFTFIAKFVIAYASRDGQMGINYFNSTESHSPFPLIFTAKQLYKARNIFPCWDEPKYKALFRLTIGINGEDLKDKFEVKTYAKQKRLDKDDHGELWTFDLAPTVMATYHLSFAFGAFSSAKTGSCENSLTTCHQHNEAWAPGGEPKTFCTDLAAVSYANLHNKEIARAATEAAIDYYCYLRNITQVDSPYRAHFVWMPMGYYSIAYENPGAVFVSHEWGEDFTMGRTKREYLHEMAHYFFGNLVTPADWKDFWISESFANYFMLLTNLKNPQIRPVGKWAPFIYRMFLSSYNSSSDPIGGYTVANDMQWAKPDSLATIDFSHIVYMKGAFVIFMLELVIGQDLLHECMKNSFKEFSNKSIYTQDLLDSYQKTLDAANFKGGWDKSVTMNITEFLYPYLFKSNHTTVRVVRKGAESTKYEISKTKPAGSENIEWHTPLWITDPNDNNHTELIWVEGDGIHNYEAKGNQEIMCNSAQFAYYYLIQEVED